jgi:hypothetical protein
VELGAGGEDLIRLAGDGGYTRPDDADKEQGMSVQSSGRSRRRPGSVWRFIGRRACVAILLFAVAIGVAGLILALAGRSVPEAGVVKAGQIVLLMLSPTLLFGAVFYAPHGLRAVRRLIDSRRAETIPQPTNPPIERVAADLRRLLWQHEILTRTSTLPMRARRLWGLEAAIADCATQAARALDVPHPHRPAHGGVGQAELRRLLRALAAEGLVLPPTVSLLAPDSRF